MSAVLKRGKARLARYEDALLKLHAAAPDALNKYRQSRVIFKGLLGGGAYRRSLESKESLWAAELLIQSGEAVGFRMERHYIMAAAASETVQIRKMAKDVTNAYAVYLLARINLRKAAPDAEAELTRAEAALFPFHETAWRQEGVNGLIGKAQVKVKVKAKDDGEEEAILI